MLWAGTHLSRPPVASSSATGSGVFLGELRAPNSKAQAPFEVLYHVTCPSLARQNQRAGNTLHLSMGEGRGEAFVAISCQAQHKPSIAQFVSFSVELCGHLFQVEQLQICGGPASSDAGHSLHPEVWKTIQELTVGCCLGASCIAAGQRG